MRGLIINTLRQYRLIREARSLHEKFRHPLENLNLEEQKILANIREKGFHVIRGYYSRQQCETIIAEIERLLKISPKNIWRDAVQADTRLYGADRLSPLIAAFHDDPFLNKMANAFNECPTTNYHTLMGKIIAAPGNLGSGQGWHRDTPKLMQFKSLMYLTDVGEENGPFEHLIGTHRINSLYSCVWRAGMQPNQYRISEAEVEALLRTGRYQKVTLTGKAGDLVLVNTFGIHRGKPIQEGCRYALTNYFFSDYTIDDARLEVKFNLPPKTQPVAI